MTQSILVTGGQGQVGRALSRFAWPADVRIVAPARDELDITDPASVDRAMKGGGIAAVVNCAAYTAVDKAESDAEAAYAVNASGAGWVARAAREAGIPIVHISTDYVFGAPVGRPRREDDPVDPQGVYGASKLAGEIAVQEACERHVILRTSWVVSPFRANFVKTMLRLAGEREEIGVVADQIGSPTGAEDIAQVVSVVARRLVEDREAPTGTYHFANAGEASWADVAEQVMVEAAKYDLRTASIRRIATSDFPTPAARPADSRLDCGKLARHYGIDARAWKTMIASIVSKLANSRR